MYFESSRNVFSLRVDAVLLNKVDAFFSNEVGSIVLESPGMFPCNNKNLHFNVNNIYKREKKSLLLDRMQHNTQTCLRILISHF